MGRTAAIGVDATMFIGYMSPGTVLFRQDDALFDGTCMVVFASCSVAKFKTQSNGPLVRD